MRIGYTGRLLGAVLLAATLASGCTAAVTGQARPGTTGAAGPPPATPGTTEATAPGTAASGGPARARGGAALGGTQAPPTPASTSAPDPDRVLPQSAALAKLLMPIPADTEAAEPWSASPQTPTVSEYGTLLGDLPEDPVEQKGLLDRRIEGLAWVGWDTADTSSGEVVLARFPNPALAAGWAASVRSRLSQPPTMQLALPGLPDAYTLLTREPDATGAARLEVLTSCEAVAVRAFFSFPLEADTELATGWVQTQLSKLSGCSGQQSQQPRPPASSAPATRPEPGSQRPGGRAGTEQLAGSARLRALLAVPNGGTWKPGDATEFFTAATGTPAELLAFIGYPVDEGNDWLLRRLQALRPDGVVATAATQRQAGTAGSADCVTALTGFTTEDGAKVWYAFREDWVFDDLGADTVPVPPQLAAGGSTVVYDGPPTDDFPGQTIALGQRGRFVAEISCVGGVVRTSAAVAIAEQQLPKLR